MPTHYAKTIETFDTDKDTHFTGALAQNAIEYEDIAYPADWGTAQIQEIRIHQISVQSDQNLDWELILWSTDASADTDLDVDSIIGRVTLLASNAYQIAGTGQFYYDYLPAEPLRYIDKDNTSELHLGLVNRSVVAKIAGATGEVKARFIAEPVW